MSFGGSKSGKIPEKLQEIPGNSQGQQFLIRMISYRNRGVYAMDQSLQGGAF